MSTMKSRVILLWYESTPPTPRCVFASSFGNATSLVNNDVNTMFISQVNTLSIQMQTELTEVINDVWANNDVKGAVLISTKPGCFFAGADIK